MATGDLSDTKARLYSVLPPWFGIDNHPVIDAVLTGLATTLSNLYALYAYAALQFRIATATDGWLDMIAQDFFGLTLPRKPGEKDASYRTRIRYALFLEKASRPGMTKVLIALTGRAPMLFEPLRPEDTGGYGEASGYGTFGGYGSMQLPYQAFVTAYRPIRTGVPMVAGYGISTGAYSTPSRAEYASIESALNSVTDEDIYQAIDNAKVAGTLIWARISY